MDDGTYDDCGGAGDESYISDNNYQQYGLDSLKTPPSMFVDNSLSKTGPTSFMQIKSENPTISSQFDYHEVASHSGNHESRSNPQKTCSFFVDSKYFGHSLALKKAFKIKNTVMKIFKYGTKDLFRFSNASLLEKFDEQEDTLKTLRNEPQVYGN